MRATARKSDVRRHTGVLRVEEATANKAKIASAMMNRSVADYVTDIVGKAAARDISREVKKMALEPAVASV